MQKSSWSVFDLTLHRFEKFCRMKLSFYSCSPMNNLSKKPPFEKSIFGKEVYVLKTGLKKSQKTTEIFLMKQVRLSLYQPTTRIWKIVCLLIQKNIRTCASWLMTPKTEDWCLRLRKEDFVSDSQSRTVKSDALLQVSLRRNKNISCKTVTEKIKWHLS